MRTPKPIQRAIEAFERLPGIGPKTAARLTYFMLHMPESRVEEFAQAFIGLKKDTQICSQCYNVDATSPCSICDDRNRDHSLICVVEQPLDLIAMENTRKYHGLYHVLHGTIDPLHHIGPDDIYLPQLIARVKAKLSSESLALKEIILALNPTMEGDATAIYIKNQLQNLRTEEQKNKNIHKGQNHSTIQPSNHKTIKITRLAQGLPLGGDLEYADAVTLSRALQGRGEY